VNEEISENYEDMEILG